MKPKTVVIIADTLLILFLLFIIGVVVYGVISEAPKQSSGVSSVGEISITSDKIEESLNVADEMESSAYFPETSNVEESVEVEAEGSIIVEEDPIQPLYDYTEEDLDLLARLINAEGGIESYETKLKIGSVVMNRVDDPNFPNTIREVIYQKNQFSVTTIKENGVCMIDRPADEESINAALEILTYGSVLPQKVQVFYHKSITTGWVASREPYGTFDRTTFAYIYKKGEQQ